tara:strand:- start:395 stop:550 length:156 start_codon:yes stop_codon:yes gene_type:complete
MGISIIVPKRYLKKADCDAGTSLPMYFTVTNTPTKKNDVIIIQKIPIIEDF